MQETNTMLYPEKRIGLLPGQSFISFTMARNITIWSIEALELTFIFPLVYVLVYGRLQWCFFFVSSQVLM
jgi:hypothetical protein